MSADEVVFKANVDITDIDTQVLHYDLVNARQKAGLLLTSFVLQILVAF